MHRGCVTPAGFVESCSAVPGGAIWKRRFVRTERRSSCSYVRESGGLPRCHPRPPEVRSQASYVSVDGALAGLLPEGTMGVTEEA